LPLGPQLIARAQHHSETTTTQSIPPQRMAVVHAVPLPTPRPALAAAPSKGFTLASASSKPVPEPSPFQKLMGIIQEPMVALGYAPTDGGIARDGTILDQKPILPNDGLTAIYDITARVVHLPDGTKLEAHSGLGPKMDDPKHVHVKMHGATPPHVYDLIPRERLFHGVEALRLIPVGGERAIFGRTGLLTHTYLLGPRGDSNGCISFKDYDKFLQAYKNGKIKRMVVVASMDQPGLSPALIASLASRTN
jgi:hypothetical protein